LDKACAASLHTMQWHRVFDREQKEGHDIGKGIDGKRKIRFGAAI